MTCSSLSLPLVLFKWQVLLFWELSASLQGFGLGIYPLYSSKVSREIEIFHLLEYASTLKLLPGNVNARRNILEAVTELKLCR